MDNSAVMKRMLETAMKAHPESFANFDVTKNAQDQLQEMVDFEPFQDVNEMIHKDCCLHSFIWFCEWGYGASHFVRQPKKIFTSMEQLWFAFMMKENHGKTWDGESWVKNVLLKSKVLALAIKGG